MTVVWDLDQAIYAFRHGHPSELLAFGRTYVSQNQLCLSGNFRSSAPICALAATFRSRRVPDTALGPSASLTHPIAILTYSGHAVSPAIGARFVVEAEAAGAPRDECIVLAHSRTVAQRSIGDPTSKQRSGKSRLETLARSVGEFWSPCATSRSRESVLLTVERLLLDLMGHWEDGEHPTRLAERLGLNRRQLRRQALELVMRLPQTCDDSDSARGSWLAAVHILVEGLSLVLPSGQTVRGYFRRPSGNCHWSEHLGPVASPSPKTSAL